MPPPPVVLPPAVTRPPVVVPTDVTNPQLVSPLPFYPQDIGTAWSLNGIQTASSFPRQQDLKGSTEWILVRKEDPTEYTRPTPYTVDFKVGRILVSVKKPSNGAIVTTPNGDVSISANGDVLLEYRDDLLRVANLDGLGESVKIRLDSGPFSGSKTQVAIAPGYELVAAGHTLTQKDMRPGDGVGRRHFKTLESGKIAVSEFSVESAMKNLAVIADMSQKTMGVKDRRILGDMSKMAAVLNYMHGTDGYKENKER